jgi:hypothetical protein
VNYDQTTLNNCVRQQPYILPGARKFEKIEGGRKRETKIGKKRGED